MGAVLVSLSLKRPASGDYLLPASGKLSGHTDLIGDFSTDHAVPAYGASAQASAIDSDSLSEVGGLHLILGDKLLSLGESVDSLTGKLGIPGRIASTEYNFDFYVYNRDYRNLLFVAVKDGLIEGFYTDSLKFNFMGIASGSTLKELNQVLNSSFPLSEIISYEAEGYVAKVLFDQEETGLVTGIYVISDQVAEDGYDASVMRDAELLNYDLVNSLRVRNGLPALAWSSTAAKASRYHSIDMAVKNYFDHIAPDQSLPGDRLQEAGILAQRVGENIIAGYGSAILSNHAWFNSPGHRKNLLNPDFVCLGVGFTYKEDSTYRTYMTQIFYK